MADMAWAEFWPFYLREHSKPLTRGLHIAGSLTALACLALAPLVSWWLLAGAVLAGYAFAWVAHFAVERNRPATFAHPWKSFVSDWRMLAAWASGRLGRELERAGVPRRGKPAARAATAKVDG